MFQKIQLTIVILLSAINVLFAQRELQNFGGYNMDTSQQPADSMDVDEHDHDQKIPSYIHSWKLKNNGALLEAAEVDTVLNFFHLYNPIYQQSISNTFTGNLGGAYLSNNFFKREGDSDFYFYRNFDLYAKFPTDIRYFNTTTPYTLLDYSQSGNKNIKNETRFNAFHSQNVNEDFNFAFFFDQAKSTGHYEYQENKFHTVGLYSSYESDQWVSHFNLLFNRIKNQENGGLAEEDVDLNEFEETDIYIVNLDQAKSSLRNNNFYWNTEYRLGKTVEVEDSLGNIMDEFIPRTGFFYQVEYSGNQKTYNDEDEDSNRNFYRYTYIDSTRTGDTIRYNRLTNTFQLKFYEAPDRKYTFTKRAYIGHDLIRIKMPVDTIQQLYKHSNTFVGGGISRDEGTFWKWGAQGKFYLTGYRSGQTELNAFIYKPMRIGKDTTSLRLSGELNTIVPDYFEQRFSSNHYAWNNRFDNINEMILNAEINSQRYKLTLGANYALIGNYIYNNAEALPTQGGSELLVVSAYLNKTIESKHWLLRGQLLWQKGNQESYLHLPDFSGYFSLNYKTIISKVLYTQIGADVRYNTEFYADAYDPATGRFYWQNQDKIGNFPFVDAHVNLKLKRTRVFFQWLNAASGLLDGGFWAAPKHPLYRRTFRLGVAWTFYD
ncbi:putative porin [uncultured Sunxiuqinia sp.]|uniref:putative porin n=1 Tax=Sunxiuqinia rutila TaxID=1397841 RepID=UPI002628EA54|nr:putative porin [uncultured Sunxiuqinia sp.]